MTKKIMPFLWFDKNMKEVVDYYSYIFPDTKVSGMDSLPSTPGGTVELATITLLDQEFQLMATSSPFKFNESISFVIDCADQEEVDHYWNALSANGGAEVECGWVKDKYGLFWQITPRRLIELMNDPDKEKRGRVIQAMLKMKKIIVKDLEEAYEG